MPKIIENIKENILAEAKEMLLKESYSDFNIRKLAQNCGLGLGTIYNYFENKEELLVHVFLHDWEIAMKLADELKEEKLPLREKLNRIYTSLETFIGQYLSIFWEMSDNGHRGCPYDYHNELHNKIKAFISAEQNTGSINTNVNIDKLSYFIMLNMLNNVKFKYLNFDEMMDCIKM